MDFKNNFRPFALSIAGLDPSAGAGLTADLKTLEQHQVYGLSVCTAVTVQNDLSFQQLEWVSTEMLLAQLEILLERYPIKAVKIGLIQSWEILATILERLPAVPIVLDPVLSASVGFVFHQDYDLQPTLKRLTLITPNRKEIVKLVPNRRPEEAAKILSAHTTLLLKGGHHETNLGRDEIWQKGKRQTVLEATTIAKTNKHGSGCVLSAAIAANLALGKDLVTACKNAKHYIEKVLNSNDSLLGYHK